MESEKLKKVVREKYGQIAVDSDLKVSSCGCGCGCDSETTYSVFSDEYSELPGYVKDADLNLGCGLPTEHAGIKEGDIVVDLGSGAGNDVFVARSFVKDTGKVIGIDFTNEMISKAERNLSKLGYKNVEFKFGDIENIPLDNSTADVVISNCVLNLVPDKQKAFNEIIRILKPGGHFCVSDIVVKGEMLEAIREDVSLYAGCVSGALKQEDYLSVIEKAGFKDISVKISKKIEIPEDVLAKYLTKEEVKEFNSDQKGIFSITVVAYK